MTIFFKSCMQTIPAELKYSQCCLKCKLVDAQSTVREIEAGEAETARPLNECKKCGGFITSYNEINTCGKTFTWILILLIAVMHRTGNKTETNMDYIYHADTVLCCIFGMIWFHNRSKKKRLENLLLKHAENKL